MAFLSLIKFSMVTVVLKPFKGVTVKSKVNLSTLLADYRFYDLTLIILYLIENNEYLPLFPHKVCVT
ncbi:hypothetical protein SDC9_208855 [bioreactor metagenome]|uniref:Uncharacterized protein n=1 Tax=bioreactor metagenome TaxID=1076179 RepID=A0A645JBT7_9ZZZZ